MDKRGQIRQIGALCSLLSVLGADRLRQLNEGRPKRSISSRMPVCLKQHRSWWWGTDRVLWVWSMDAGWVRIRETYPICGLRGPKCVSGAQHEGLGDQYPFEERAWGCQQVGGMTKQHVWMLWREWEQERECRIALQHPHCWIVLLILLLVSVVRVLLSIFNMYIVVLLVLIVDGC